MWYAASPSSNVRVLRVRAVLREAALRMEDQGNSAAVPIPQVQRAVVSRRVREWAVRRACRLRESQPSRQDVRERLRGVRDSVISKDRKKVR